MRNQLLFYTRDLPLGLERQLLGRFRVVCVGHLAIIVAASRYPACGGAVQPRDYQALGLIIDFGSVEGVVIGAGINGPHGWTLICSEADHPTVELRQVSLVGLNDVFDVSEEIVVIPLQRLMVSSSAVEVKDQLHRSCESNPGSGPDRAEAEVRQQISHGGSSQNDDNETEPFAPALVRQPARGVIERIAKDVEANVVAVWGQGHLSFFGGLIGADGFCGCLGPGVPSGFGCRGPIEWIDISAGRKPTFEVLPNFIAIVSLWADHEGMNGTGALCRAHQCLYFFGGVEGVGFGAGLGAGWRGPKLSPMKILSFATMHFLPCCLILSSDGASLLHIGPKADLYARGLLS